MRVLCVAGEASGDALLAPVVATIVARGARAVGVGGDRSAEAGLELVAHARDVAGHGLVEAVHTVPAVWRAWRRLRALLAEVDGLVLVDFPEVNGRLLGRATRRGLPAIWLAPPQAWAWRPWRARSVARARHVGCLLPFEAEWYRARGVDAACIGHPLAARDPLPMPGGMGLALLPGSRAPTVARLLPMQLEAAAHLRRRFPALTVHLGVAPTLDAAPLAAALRASGLPGAVHRGADAALAASTVALAGAGTATLHAALAGRPVVTMAALHPISAAVARRLVRVEHAGLPNLVLGRRAFPERVLDDCRAESLADALAPLLADPGGWAAPLAELRARVHRPEGAAVIEGWVDGLLAPP